MDERKNAAPLKCRDWAFKVKVNPSVSKCIGISRAEDEF
jgi:hypothetical protein